MRYEKYDSLILSASGSICYICDRENYELLHLTKAGMEVYGFTAPEDYKGKKCYEILQGRDAPCPFCNNRELCLGKEIRWEHYNEKLHRWFDITDSLIETDGRLCRLEIARDITARKAQELSAQAGSLSMEDVLFRCLHVLAVEQDMQAAVNQFLSNVGSFYQAARTYIFEFDMEKGITNNTFEWCGPGVSREIDNLQDIPLEVVADWIRKFEQGDAFAINSLDRDRDPDSEEYRILQAQGINSLLAAPLMRDKQIVGFIGVDDPEKNGGNPQLLKSVSEFILAELERRRLLQELERMHFSDILTGVGNRSRYRKLINDYLTVPPEKMGVAKLSVNGLKIINESFGQKYGDNVIIRTAEKLEHMASGKVCRVGGDEFVLFCPGLQKKEFEKTVARLQEEFDKEQDFSVAMGYTWDDGNVDVNTLLLRAEEWMRGRKQRYYQEEISKGRAVGNAADDLFRDIKEQRFTVWYQPQVDLRTGAVSGMEALVRKLGEDGEIIPPGRFIPYYEARNILQHLDMHVLELVLCDMQKLMAQGIDPHISVNFSRGTLMTYDFAEMFAAKCAFYGVEPSRITVEVTETITGIDRGTLKELLNRLRKMGLKLSLDDFGTEYSNLSILTDVEFDEVKFDKSLVDNICTSGRNQVILGRLMQMCRQLQQGRIVAEGIEDAGQVEILKSYGCDCGQGYYFHKPLPFADMQAVLLSRKSFETAQVQQNSDSFLTGQDYQLRYTLEEVLLQLVDGGGDLFGYRVEGRRGLFSQRLAELFRIPEQIYDFPQLVVDSGKVAEDNIGDWLALFSAIHRGDKHGSARVSFQINGRFYKYYLRFNSFADEENAPIFATVSFEDVEQEHMRTKQQDQDINALVQAVQKNFPEILTLNLTKNTYRMFSYHGGTTVGTPRQGSIDTMLQLRRKNVVPEDRAVFADTFNQENLTRIFVEEGKEQMRLAYRRPDNEGAEVWFETTVMRQANEADDDVMLIAMSREVNAQKAEEIRIQEQLWLQAEALRVTTGRMRRTICFYDILQHTLTVPQEYAKRYGIPDVLPNYPEQYLKPDRLINMDTKKKIRNFYDAIQQGAPEGICEVCSEHPQMGVRWKKWEFATVCDRKGVPSQAVIFVEDITEEKKAHMEIRHRAERDGMTGLLNRVTTQERIIRLMETEAPGILIHIDLDDLKTINDTYGHGEGDRALQSLADALRQHFRESDVIGRIGGDEFLVYLPAAASKRDAIGASLSQLLEKLSVVSVGTGDSHHVHCSIGCAVQKDRTDTFDGLYKQADMALYQVKRGGKNNFAFYTPDMEL